MKAQTWILIGESPKFKVNLGYREFQTNMS